MSYPSYEYLTQIAANLTEVEKLILFTSNERYSPLAGHSLDFSAVPAQPVLMSEDHDWYQGSTQLEPSLEVIYMGILSKYLV